MENQMQLFNENLKMVDKMIYSYVKAHPADADDIKQVALLSLWRAAGAFRDDKGAKFTTFAYRVITNDLNLFARKYKKENLDIPMDTPIYEDVSLEQTLKDTKEYISDADTKLFITEILKNSHTSEKHINVFKDILDGYTLREIAKKHNISRQQVWNIKDKLRKIIIRFYKR